MLLAAQRLFGHSDPSVQSREPPLVELYRGHWDNVPRRSELIVGSSGPRSKPKSPRTYRLAEPARAKLPPARGGGCRLRRAGPVSAVLSQRRLKVHVGKAGDSVRGCGLDRLILTAKW